MIAVIGAGGSTGLECVKCLCAQGLPVRAVVRSPEKYAELFPAAAEVWAGDATDAASLRAALAGCRGVVFAAAGKGKQADAVGHRGVAATARIAQELGAKVVLVSSRLANRNVFGWSPLRMFLNTITWGGMDAKMAGEAALRCSGASYCIVRPGGLVHGENGVTHGATDLTPAGGDFVIATAADIRAAGPRQICRVDVAAVVVLALLRDDATGKTVEVVARRREDADPPSEKHLRTIFDAIPHDPEAQSPALEETTAVEDKSCKRRVRRCKGGE